MEESDQEMSEDVDSDNEGWAGLIPGPDERTEQCSLGQDTVDLPELLLEKKHIFMSVLSMDTWKNALSAEKRKRLEELLPTFDNNDDEEKEETVRRLLNGDNFKFGNPVLDLQKKLKEGYLHPEIARYRKQTRQFRYRDYKIQHQRYLSDLLKQLLLSRQEVFEQASTLAPGEPIKYQHRPLVKKKANNKLEEIVRKKTLRIMKEVRDECGIPDTSSDEDDEANSPVQRSRRQLFKSLGPIPSPEPTLPSVVATFANKPTLMNGDLHNGMSLTSTPQIKRPRAISPVEVTDDSYRIMLKMHKRKKLLDPDQPELDTSCVTLEDILSRCQANKKNSKSDATTGNPATMKKRLKMKAKGEKKRKMKVKESPSLGEDDLLMPGSGPPALPSLDTGLPFSPMEDVVPDDPPIQKAVFVASTNFFCLLRDILSEFPDGKATLAKVEESVREWLDNNDEISNPWLALQKSWVELVSSALKFLAGNEIGIKVENFVPLVDFRDRAQQWKWIGVGRDGDPELTSLFRHWLQHKDDVSVLLDPVQGDPPPPKAKTSFIVRPTSSNEKALFREQERRRFAAPHKAFTFMMHGYEAVVGPVKGVYDKDSGTNKAREHNLLVSDRPPFVTILTLVRDAAARLPNGEGTRGDICELLKDSQFLAPGVTDVQINAVVSGALDRLHSEKDPCVKYDVTRKLWIYLHRNRTEDEFERIHQAQAAVVKAKKTLARPKTSKASKDPMLQTAPVTAVSTTLVSQSVIAQPAAKPTFTLSTLPISASGKSSPTESPSGLSKASKIATSLARAMTLGKGSAVMASASPGVNMQPTVAQLRAAQVAMTKSSASVSKLPTVKQLTSGLIVTTASPSVTTSSVLTVTSVGLNVNSSLAAQLLYSSGLTPAATGASKYTKTSSTPVTTATTFSLVTTMNVSQNSSSGQHRPNTIPTISMLHNQQLLKQQQQQQAAGAQSVLKQNAALVAAVGQTVGAVDNSLVTVSGSSKNSGLMSKHTFSMTARQGVPPNAVAIKNQGAVMSSKAVSGLKQTSLILSQDGMASLTPVSSAAANTQGKLVALTSMPGSVQADGTVMAQIVQHAPGGQIGNHKGGAAQAIKLQGGSLVQPVLGGKPIHIGGKPFAQAKGLVQLAAGRAGQPVGLIRTPQGPMTLIPQHLVSSANLSGISSAGKAATVVAVGNPGSLTPPASGQTAPISVAIAGSNSHTSSTHTVNSRSGVQARMLNQQHTGIVVTQLPQGNIALRSGAPGSSQAKMIPAAQAGLLPTQFILQHAPAGSPSSHASAVQAPLIVSSQAPGVKGAQNLQVMRTVLSQQGGLKPGQATILISQPALPQAVPSTAGLTPAQVVQAGAKNSGRGSPKGKGQPVYARIITPPPGMKLTGMAQVPGAGQAMTGVNVMGKLLSTSQGLTTHNLSSIPMVSLAVPPGVINQAATASSQSMLGNRVEVATVVTEMNKPNVDS